MIQFKRLLPWSGWCFRAVVFGVLLTAAWGASSQPVGGAVFLVLTWAIGAVVSLPARDLIRIMWVKRRRLVSWAEARASVRLVSEFKRMVWTSGLGVRHDEHDSGLMQEVAVSTRRQVADVDDVSMLDCLKWVLVVVFGLMRWSDVIAYKDTPRIVRREVTPHGLVLTVRRGAKAQTSADLVSAEMLARVEQAARETTGFSRLRLRGEIRGALAVWKFTWRDALTAPVSVPPVQWGRDVDLDAPILVGTNESGGAFRLPVFGRQTLLVGASGAGKGSVIWSVLLALAPAIRSGLVRVWGVDLKGGVEFTTGADLFHHVAYTYEDAQKMFSNLRESLDDRLVYMRAQGLRKHVPSVEEPYDLVVVDEAASLVYLAPDTKTQKSVDGDLKRVLSTGRAAGMSLLAALQDPRKEALATRDLFTQMVALRLRSTDDAKLAIGASTYEAGAHCEQIPQSQPGTGFAIDSETSEVVRFRAFWCSDDDISGCASVVAESRVHGG